MDRLDTPFLPSSNPVEEIRFPTTASSLKLWFYFMIQVFPLAVELFSQIRTWVCPCKSDKSQWGSVRGAADLTRWILFQHTGFNISILQWDGIINHRWEQVRDKKRFLMRTEECLECKHHNYLLIWIKLYSREHTVREGVLGFRAHICIAIYWKYDIYFAWKRLGKILNWKHLKGLRF